MALVAEMKHQTGRKPNVVLVSLKGIGVEIVRFQYPNTNSWLPVVVVTGTASKGATHALESGSGQLLNIRGVLSFAKQTLEIDVGLFATEHVLRANHVIPYAYPRPPIGARVYRDPDFH